MLKDLVLEAMAYLLTVCTDRRHHNRFLWNKYYRDRAQLLFLDRSSESSCWLLGGMEL